MVVNLFCVLYVDTKAYLIPTASDPIYKGHSWKCQHALYFTTNNPHTVAGDAEPPYRPAFTVDTHNPEREVIELHILYPYVVNRFSASSMQTFRSRLRLDRVAVQIVQSICFVIRYSFIFIYISNKI